MWVLEPETRMALVEQTILESGDILSCKPITIIAIAKSFLDFPKFLSGLLTHLLCNLRPMGSWLAGVGSHVEAAGDAVSHARGICGARAREGERPL